MPKSEKIKLSIRGGGLSYVSGVTSEVAAKVMALCLSLPQQSNVSESIGSEHTRLTSSSQESLVEYMNHHAPRRNPDKILAMAGYMKEALGKHLFHPNEIRSLFRDAGEAFPGNFSRDFQWTVRSGWIARDPVKKKIYYVTNTGSRVLEGGFPEELVKKSENKAVARRRKKVAKK